MKLPLAVATAALFITASPAAGAPVTLEAETLSLPSGSGQVVPGGLKIWSTATATGSVTSRATRRITVRARGEQCNGAPRMIVLVDGHTALDVNVSATSWTDYAADLSLADGAHTLTVRFDNDARTATCDRNLFVDRAVLTSVAARPFPARRFSGSARRQREDRRPATGVLVRRLERRHPRRGRLDDDGGAEPLGRVPVLVAYDIPQRDCGSFSAGGRGLSQHLRRVPIRAFAAGIGPRQ